MLFLYDIIHNREIEGVGEGKVRDNYGTNGVELWVF